MFDSKVYAIKPNLFKFLSATVISLVLCFLVYLYQSNKINVFEINQQSVMNVGDFIKNTEKKIYSKITSTYNLGENIIGLLSNIKDDEFLFLNLINDDEKWEKIFANFSLNFENNVFNFIHGNLFVSNFNEDPLRYYDNFKNNLSTIYPQFNDFKILEELFTKNADFNISFKENGYYQLSSNVLSLETTLIYNADNRFIENNVIRNINIKKIIPIYINYYFENNFYDTYKSTFIELFNENITSQITLIDNIKKYYVDNLNENMKKYYLDNKLNIDKLTSLDLIIFEYESIRSELINLIIQEDQNILPYQFD